MNNLYTYGHIVLPEARLSYPTFDDASVVVDKFLSLLEVRGLGLKRNAPSEDEALAMRDILDMWKNPASRPTDHRDVVRTAMGFVDLAGKVVAVEQHPNFGQLWPHLEMISDTSVLQNNSSPITDAAANKVIELYMACLAMTFASDVALDHPTSSKGDNPDVMFDFRGKRWALALKTLHSVKPRTIYDNIKKGSDQIEASDADHGLILLNMKNVLDHEAIWPPTGSMPVDQAIDTVIGQITDTEQTLSEIPSTDWAEILAPSRKAEIPVLMIGHTATSTVPPGGTQPLFTSVKVMRAYMRPKDDPSGSMKLAEALNHAMQQFP